MAEAQALGGIGDESEDDGFVVIERPENDQRKGRTNSGEVPFVITDEHEEKREQRRAQASASVGVDQPLPRSRKCSVCGEAGHTSRTCPNVGATDRVTKAPRASGNSLSPAVPIFLGTINMMVTSAFGESCGISEKETQFMIPSMQRMSERMPKAAAEKMSLWIDPVVIVSCFIFWGSRIRKIKADEARQQFVVEPFERARANGYTGATYDGANAVTNSPSQATPKQESNGGYTPPNSNGTSVHLDTPPEPTSNGVPQAIRDAFDERI